MYDIIIVGGGPAGLTAAVYARRASKNVLVLEKETFGGQITFSPKVENIPGFSSISGSEFADLLVSQALSQEVECELAEVLEIRDKGDVKTVVTDMGEYETRSVIIAAGARHRLLGLPGEEQFIGNGESFCAVCDGAFYAGETVGVVGGGNSALQEALLLSELAEKVYIFQDLDFLTGEEKLQELLRGRENVEVITGTRVTGLLGEESLSGIRVYVKAEDREMEYSLAGLFVAIGLVPQNEIFENVLALDSRGYADADESCLTGTPGIFVAGDCRRKKVRQVATAAADGAAAALAACDYLDGRA